METSFSDYDDFEKETAFNKGEEKGLNITLKKRLVLIGPITEAGQTEGRAVARNLLIDSFKAMQAYQLITLPDEKEAEALKQSDVNIKTVLSHLLTQGGLVKKLPVFFAAFLKRL